MKINLLLDAPQDCLNGYINVDPLRPDDAKDGRLKGEVSNLDWVLDDGEATELIAKDILPYWGLDHVNGIFKHWVSKLAHGGTITVSMPDLLEISKAVAARQISVDAANVLLYGDQRQPWQNRKCAFTLEQVAAVLRSMGLRILKKRVEQFMLYVVAQRP